MAFPKELVGGIWHTTSEERYSNIIESGGILPNPDITEKERWGTSRGSEYYPFVRTIHGVSLFDFCDFNAEEYSKLYPASCWSEFVPYRKEWGCSIWVEIDRKAVIENFISGSELLKKWNRDKAYKNNIMPLIEAAHIGAIPASSFLHTYFSSESGFKLKEN